MVKKTLLTLAVALFLQGAWADTWTDPNTGIEWTYTVSDGEASAGSGSYSPPAVPRSTLGAITIPSMLGGYTVTSIGRGAFRDCSGLTSVTIPSSVTNIGDWAFGYCSGLTSVKISAGVTSIGKDVFYGCSGLRRFDVAEDNPKFKSVNGLLLTKDGETLIAGINGDVTIPSSVTSIGIGAFEDCSGLTSVEIPSSVTSIGTYAFYSCILLTGVTIPSSVTNIGECAFGCSGLISVTISNGVTSIGHVAFGCSALTSVMIPSSVTNIGEYAFGECSELTSVTICHGVPCIGYGAFSCCSITNVAIPSSVTNIGEYAFSGCDEQTHVHVSKGDVERIKGLYDWDTGIVFVEDPTTDVKHSVAFNANGGTCVTTSISVEDGDVVGLLPSATRDGYDFLGWFTAADGGEQVTAATVVTEEVTWYAHWKEQTVTPTPSPTPDPEPTPDPDPEPEPVHETPTLFESVTGGGVNEKGATYNGVMGEETMGGTFTLVVKKAKNGVATATMTRVDPSTGKKVKVTGTVDVDTGVCSGGLAGLKLGEKGVTGTYGGKLVQGAVDASKAKDNAMLNVMNGFNKKSYSLVLADSRGSDAVITVTFSTKGKAKIAGTTGGNKVSGSAQMSVGDNGYAMVPFSYAKKNVALSFILWFDTSTKKLCDVSGIGTSVTVAAAGEAAAPAAGTYVFTFDRDDIRAAVPTAIAETPVEAKVTWNGKKFDAGKAAKVTYDKKAGAVKVDTSKGSNISGLTLKYSKGALSGSFTVYGLSGTKLTKNKFTISGVIIDGVGYATGVNKKLGSIAVELEK